MKLFQGFGGFSGQAEFIPNAMVLLNETDVTSASTISFDNVFSSTYDNYLVVASGVAVTQANSILIRMRLAGTDNTSTQYIRQSIDQSGAVTSSRGSLTTSWTNAAFWEATLRNAFSITIFDPAKASTTSAMTRNPYPNQNMVQYYLSHYVGVAYDGFTVIAGTTSLTGNFKVYGLVNS